MYQQHQWQHNSSRGSLKEQKLQSQQLQNTQQQSQTHIRPHNKSPLQPRPIKEGQITLQCGSLDGQQEGGHQQHQNMQQIQQLHHHQHHNHHHQQHQKSHNHYHLLQQQQQQQQYQHQRQKQPQQQQSPPTATTTPQQAADRQQQSSFESRIQPSMAYQHKHALHRLRRLKKRSPHRDLVISFVPRLRTSIINRLDFFNRYSKQEQEVLSCFDFLDELVLNYCDGGSESPRYSQKLYQSMIYEFI